MRQLKRSPLSPHADGVLGKRTAKVKAAQNPQAEARRLWQQRQNKAFDEIRKALRQMASGLERCMYCEDSAGTDIEHFWPKANFPERAYTWENYLLACSHCNSNAKRNQFPLDKQGKPLLLNPTTEDPLHHLVFSPSTGEFTPRLVGKQESPKGRESIRVFGLDRPLLNQGRYNAWTALRYLLRDWWNCQSQGKWQEADRLKACICQAPFSSVFAAMIRIADGPAAHLVPHECRDVLKAHPQIRQWV